jgi:hypothetical protein
MTNDTPTTDPPPHGDDAGQPVTKGRPLSEDERTEVVRTLRACVLFEALLSRFESRLARDLIDSYAQFGAKTYMSDKQISLLREISRKLCLE